MILKNIITSSAKTFVITASVATLFAFQNQNNRKLSVLDVERINIIEKDGTVKMVITNADLFPSSGDEINGQSFHERKKRAGMLFFTEDGKECGGFIYDGSTTKDGHSAGLSLTYDQYDGDQVMQLITTDEKQGDNRYKSSRLVFNDRGANETRASMMQFREELNNLTDPNERKQLWQSYQEKGLIGGVPRVALGQTAGQQNGLFLFDKQGNIRANLIIDSENNPKLQFFDEDGNVVSCWPKDDIIKN